MPWTRTEIAARAALELDRGDVVNLGIGIPTLVTEHLAGRTDVTVHAENGVLGVGRVDEGADADPDLINAGKQPVTIGVGASFFDSATSFAMVRGGHIDVAVLGAMQVSADGDLANWMVPGALVTGIGGAMDLVVGVKRIIVVTDHLTRSGTSKLVDCCTYPLTGRRVVSRVITDLGVFDPIRGSFRLVELAPGVSADEVSAKTGAPLVGELMKDGPPSGLTG